MVRSSAACTNTLPINSFFLEKNVQGKYYVSWSLRWPKNTLDPLPQTPEIDLCYPELFTVNGRPTELDVYYVKEGE